MSYLTECNLKLFILDNLKHFSSSEEDVLFNKKLNGFFPDILLKVDNLVLEFDGYFHFNSYKQQQRDLKKDSVFKANNLKVIRIPYFIQLSSLSIKYFFNINLDFSQTYNHGFIDKKALRPCDFNSFGLGILKKYLTSIPEEISNDIVKTLTSYELGLI